MLRLKNYLLLLPFSLFLLSCETDDTLPETFEYSEKIIGEWRQTRTFNLVDASSNPPEYDWFDLEDGFNLQLFEDGSFTYSRYGDCSSGDYFFDHETAQITFYFDCKRTDSEATAPELTERFAEDVSQNDQLFLIHSQGSGLCEEQCSSILRRIR